MKGFSLGRSSAYAVMRGYRNIYFSPHPSCYARHLLPKEKAGFGAFISIIYLSDPAFIKP